MAWNSTKSAGDLIKSADWNALVSAIGSCSYDLEPVTKLGSGNTYLEVDANNSIMNMYIAGTKVALLDSSGNLKIKGSFYEGQTL